MTANRAPLLLGLFLALCPPAALPAPPLAVEVGGGIHTPLSGDLREQFAQGGSASLGISAPLRDRLAYSVELGLHRGRVNDTLEGAGTDPGVHTRVPLRLGLRMIPRSENALNLHLSFGLSAVYCRYEDAAGASSWGPAFGAYVDLRPTYAVTPQLDLWVRPRLELLTDTRYQGGPSYNYSDFNMLLGLSIRPKTPLQ